MIVLAGSFCISRWVNVNLTLDVSQLCVMTYPAQTLTATTQSKPVLKTYRRLINVETTLCVYWVN